jgi:hypothetical protein
MVIADISIEVLKQKSNFKDYIAGCNYIHNYLSVNNTNGIYHLIEAIIIKLEPIFGLEIDITIEYVDRYFMEKHYETYYSPMKEIRGYFGKYVINNLNN